MAQYITTTGEVFTLSSEKNLCNEQMIGRAAYVSPRVAADFAHKRIEGRPILSGDKKRYLERDPYSQTNGYIIYETTEGMLGLSTLVSSINGVHSLVRTTPQPLAETTVVDDRDDATLLLDELDERMRRESFEGKW